MLMCVLNTHSNTKAHNSRKYTQNVNSIFRSHSHSREIEKLLNGMSGNGGGEWVVNGGELVNGMMMPTHLHIRLRFSFVQNEMRTFELDGKFRNVSIFGKCDRLNRID